MKILIVSQYFWPEPFRVNDLSTELAERGHDVTVYTGLPNYPEGAFLKGYSFKGPYTEYYGKVKVIRTPVIPRGKNKSLRLALNFFSFFFISTLLAPFLIRGKFDKIFVYEVSPITVAIPGIFIKYFKKIPMIMWVTDLWPESLEATGVVKNKKIIYLVSLMVKWIYKHTDKILVSSKGFVPRVMALGVAKDKIKYWPQWAESFFGNSDQPSSFRDYNLPISGFKIMFAGNIGTSQDFETIIKAAQILKNEKHIHFLVLGDGLMKEWAEQKIREFKLQDTFHFLGRKPVESMPYYFSHADVLLVSLTNTDLFSITVPGKLQSYLASGKAILASLNGEGADIVNEWNAGLSCPATSPSLLAETILKMSFLSREALMEFGKNALKCYQSEFERSKLISVLETELEELQFKKF